MGVDAVGVVRVAVVHVVRDVLGVALLTALLVGRRARLGDARNLERRVLAPTSLKNKK